MSVSEEWRKPYRSMDASGSPESAGQVGWQWLFEICREEHDRDFRGLELDHMPNSHHAILYRDCKPIAAYFVVRDPMNFAQLFRWRS